MTVYGSRGAGCRRGENPASAAIGYGYGGSSAQGKKSVSTTLSESPSSDTWDARVLLRTPPPGWCLVFVLVLFVLVLFFFVVLLSSVVAVRLVLVRSRARRSRPSWDEPGESSSSLPRIRLWYSPSIASESLLTLSSMLGPNREGFLGMLPADELLWPDVWEMEIFCVLLFSVLCFF